MSHDATLQAHGAHGHHDGHHEHHEQHFITKYIFSQDHKMIGKQYLVTGIIWAVIGALFSVFFRLQLGFPESNFPIMEQFLGEWAKGGKLSPEFYYAMVTMHGTILVFFVLTAGLSGTFSNFLIPLQIGARDMASPFMNMLSYWFFFAHLYRSCSWWLDDLPSFECFERGFFGFWFRYGLMVDQYDFVHRISGIRWFELRFYYP
jgi:cytochrome c oxidase subunit 1